MRLFNSIFDTSYSGAGLGETDVQQIWLAAAGVVLALLSCTKFVANLKPSQLAGFGLAMFLIILPFLPQGSKFAVAGASYESSERVVAAEVVGTNAQFNAMIVRIAALERKFTTLTSSTATASQRQHAIAEDNEAKRRYAAAAKQAAAARMRYLVDMRKYYLYRSLDYFNSLRPVDTDTHTNSGCCGNDTTATESHDPLLASDVDSPNVPSCCSATVEAVTVTTKVPPGSPYPVAPVRK